MFENLQNPNIIYAYGIPESPLNITSAVEYFSKRFEVVYWKEEGRSVIMLMHPAPYVKYTFADFQAMHDTGIWLTELRPDFCVYEENDGAYFKAGALELKIGDRKDLLYGSIAEMAEKNGMVLA